VGVSAALGTAVNGRIGEWENRSSGSTHSAILDSRILHKLLRNK
jgi:hypothetical protein